MTSLLVSSRNAGNLKLFWFQVHSELQKKTTQNPKLALSSSPRTQKLKEKRSRFCAGHFTEDSFEQSIAITIFVGTLFQASSTCTQERHGTYDVNFPMAGCWTKKRIYSCLPVEQMCGKFGAVNLDFICTGR